MNPYPVALKIAAKVPSAFRYWAAYGASRIAVAARYSGARQLQANLAQAGEEDVVGALASYYRYFADLGNFASPSRLRIDAAVDAKIPAQLYRDLAAGPVCVALGHTANWDLVGAWAAQNLAGLTTVAEEVAPKALFDTFTELRARNNMKIIPAKKGNPVFRELLRQGKEGAGIIALLADRDITGAGIEVDLFGAKALVAAGPAALAKRLGAPLYVAAARDIPLNGARAKAAGTKNGVEMIVRGPLDTAGTVEQVTAVWVQEFETMMRPWVKSWHMCQPVFVRDLDPERLERSRKKHAQMEQHS